ncbi:uncharacterized protein LOC142334059 [Lycorma delicatula]|uniref:uncharacterized protein LOC142334059 n=1 Tax=Lycorma delicatula TaxID=130591 RepID=UPI003F519EC2
MENITTMFLITPISLLKYGTITTLASIILATLIQNVQCNYIKNHKTSLGIWFITLSYIAGIGLISHALAATLYYIDGLHGATIWLKSFTTSSAISLLTIIIITTIIVLCSLGLERSTLLRTILIFSICSTLTVLALNTPIQEWSIITVPVPDNISQVLQSTLLTIAGFITLTSDSNNNNQLDYEHNLNNNNKKNMINVICKTLTLCFIMVFITISLGLNLFQPHQTK